MTSYENIEVAVAQIPDSRYTEFELIVAIARALNVHFDEFARDTRMTDARLHALESNVKSMNEKLDKLIAQLSPQSTPKRDLRKPSNGGAP